MAQKIKVPEPSPFVRYTYKHGDDYIPPTYVPDAIEHQVRPTIDVESDPIDTTYSPDEILSNAGELQPLRVPVLLGLRKAIKERRINRINSELPDLEHSRQVRQFVGESVLRNKSFMAHVIDGEPNMTRPTSKNDLSAAEKLDKLTIKARRAQQLSFNIQRPFDGSTTPSASNPGSLTPIANPTPAERKHFEKSTKLNNETVGQIEHFDKRFTDIVQEPVKRAEKVIAKRNSTTITLARIERQQELKKQRKQERREEKKVRSRNKRQASISKRAARTRAQRSPEQDDDPGNN